MIDCRYALRWMGTGPGLALVAVVGCSDGGSAAAPTEPAACEQARLAYEDEPAQTGHVRHVHDPSIHRHGEYYYVFSTNDGIPIRRSQDLVRWEFLGRVFEQQLPSWASSTIPGVEAPWAPDVVILQGMYHLYYSLSTFGSQRSAIGVTVNETLDPTDARYRWQDRGRVLESWPGVSEHNAIDPTVVFDHEEDPWLAWGSWSGGIMIRRLDPGTGMLSTADTVMHRLATRTALSTQNAIEGAYILRRGEYFYLFVSFDLCCRGAESTYNVRVGRSRSVTGPFTDMAGQSMMQGGGTLLLASYGRVRGPGHGSVLTDEGRHFFVHHFYDPWDGGVPQLQVRAIYWDEDDWPLIGEPYRGEADEAPVREQLVGDWGYWADSDQPTRVRLNTDGSVERCDATGGWSFDPPRLTIEWSTGGGAVQRVSGTVSADGDRFVGRDPEHRPVRAYFRARH